MAAPTRIGLLGIACPRCKLVSNFHRSFSTLNTLYARKKTPRPFDNNVFTKRLWNIEHGLPATGYEYGPLTEVSDWSYADGRPAPLPAGTLRRREENRKLAMRAMRLIGEMEFAKKRHRSQLEEEKEQRQAILDNKLKPKC